MDERVIVWKHFGATVIHPVALSFTIAMGLALLLLRRERAAVPLVFVACFLPVEQRIVVAGLDFDMTRLMILFGWTRLLMRGEIKNLERPNRVDWTFIAWMVSGSIFYVLRELSAVAIIYRFGEMFEAFGMFFLFRALVRDEQDARRAIRTLAWMCVVTGAFMTIEQLTGRNFFSVLGGVDEFSIVRDGRIRSQGSFSGPIMAGSFGATTFPLIVGLMRDRGSYLTVAIGLAGAVLVTLTAASSGALIALLAGLVGLALWPARRRMREIRWSIFGVLLVVHLIREKPVWQLIDRLSDFIGGSGYHRYALIDAFLQRWSEWALLGTKSTAHWGWGLQDLTNQFVYEGVTGGLVTLLLFVALLSYAFANVAIGMRGARGQSEVSRDARINSEFFAWCFGASLVAHLFSWISVSYYGQMMVLLYLQLAMVSSLASPEFWRQSVRARPRPVARAEIAAEPPSKPEPIAMEPDEAPSSVDAPSLGKGLLQRPS